MPAKFHEVVALARESLICARRSPAEAREVWQVLTDAREQAMVGEHDPDVSDMLAELDEIAAEAREFF